MAPNMTINQAESFYRAYETVESDDAIRFSFWDFKRLVTQGHIVCGVVEGDGEVVCLFAVELMLKPMTHICFLFWVGTINRTIAREMLFWLWNALQHFKLGVARPVSPGAVRIVGRRGWTRILAAMGIAMDADGYIREDQDGVQRLLYRRFV